MITIRNERQEDFRRVEEITRSAFYNLHAPGCAEHYLAHVLRGHRDFVPELDFVIEVDGQVVGNIMYTKARLVNQSGEEKPVLTFGPISVLPRFQRRGLGKMLIEHSFKKAAELGWATVVIFGNPDNYVGRGFKSCRKYNVCLTGGVYPTAMLVKELTEGVLTDGPWDYCESPAMDIDPQAAEMFDRGFEPMEKKVLPSQEAFYIYSHSTVTRP